jgi:hypothetical protein
MRPAQVGLCVLCVSLFTAAIGIPGVAFAGPPPKNFSLIAVQTSEGPGQGQEVVSEGNLVSNGQVVGHNSFTCSPTAEGQQFSCSGTLRFNGGFANGAIRVSGQVSAAPTASYSVTGGSGDFKGASGTVTSQDIEGGNDATLTFQLKLPKPSHKGGGSGKKKRAAPKFFDGTLQGVLAPFAPAIDFTFFPNKKKISQPRTSVILTPGACDGSGISVGGSFPSPPIAVSKSGSFSGSGTRDHRKTVIKGKFTDGHKKAVGQIHLSAPATAGGLPCKVGHPFVAEQQAHPPKPSSDPVTRWRATVIRALQLIGYSDTDANVGGILTVIRCESGGNPNAENNWDSNAQAGQPSAGLMQIMDPTFEKYRDPALPDDIFDPVANVYAGVGYAVGRYGSIAAIPPVSAQANGSPPCSVGFREAGPPLLAG